MFRTVLLSFISFLGLIVLIFTPVLVTNQLDAHDVAVTNQLLNHPVSVSQNQNGFNIYAIDANSGKSLKALYIDMEVVDSLGVPAITTLLGRSSNPFTGDLISVYRLTSGEFQIDTAYGNNQLYRVTWDESGNMIRNTGE